MRCWIVCRPRTSSDVSPIRSARTAAATVEAAHMRVGDVVKAESLRRQNNRRNSINPVVVKPAAK